MPMNTPDALKKIDDLAQDADELMQLEPAQLRFLVRMPMLLNSSLDSRQVIATALESLQHMIGAEAVTVFTLSKSGKELVFWALQGNECDRLEGKRMPADAGIVGWVIKNKETVLVDDVKSDPRFFSQIDKEGSFDTKSLICVPLLIKGGKTIGAIQALNKHGGSFVESDLAFLERCSHQVALAIENAELYNESKIQSQRLAILDRSKNDLISIISHEFRTPLNLVQNASEILLMEDLPEDDKKPIAQALVDAVKRLDELIGQVGGIASLNEGEVKVHIQPFEVAPLLYRIATDFEPALAERKLKLVVDIAKRTDAVVADPTLLLVVLKNLISNAIRFTPDGGEIILSARRMSGLVEFSVRDTGIGIPGQEIPCIFEKFYEVGDLLEHSSGSFEFKSSGLGLGLATARTIVEAHGSSIEVVSDVDQGSRFSFCLPAEDA